MKHLNGPVELIQERPLGANTHTLPGSGRAVTVQKLHLLDFALVWTEEKHAQLPNRDMKTLPFSTACLYGAGL